MWSDALNVDTFLNMRLDLDGNIPIGMDLCDGKRPRCGRLELVQETQMIAFVYQISDSIVMTDSFSVLTKKAFVNKELSVLVDGNDVRQDWNIEEHVATKRKHSRRVPGKQLTARAARSMHCCSQCLLNATFTFLN